jgi:hypothetical protein
MYFQPTEEKIAGMNAWYKERENAAFSDREISSCVTKITHLQTCNQKPLILLFNYLDYTVIVFIKGKGKVVPVLK